MLNATNTKTNMILSGNENTMKIAADEAANQEIVRKLAESIDIYSPISVLEFGKQVAKETSSYADALLQKARINDLNGVGTQLNNILVKAKDFNISSIENKWSRTPLVGGLMKKLVLGKEKAMAKFDNVRNQVDEIVNEVAKTSQMLEGRGKDFQNMYEGVKQEYNSLGHHILAIAEVIKTVEQKIGSLSHQSDTMEATEELALLSNAKSSLEKRAADLQVLQHSAMQTLPMIRIMQANNLSLVDKFHTITTLTLPTWKRTFLMALTLDEQKEAVSLSDAIDNATNEMLKRNADLLHQNSVATAKANQRLVINVDTLQEVHNKVLQTLVDVKEVHSEGAKNRAAMIDQLSTLRNEMVGSYQKLSVLGEPNG